eukprot:Nitzschia sp. Nitz4//scaffold230_size58257//28259//30405//NITZ4_006482-RA/size58257-augustus-gene-0.4-mRNA-1//1//CDS//3329543253//7449//frame0
MWGKGILASFLLGAVAVDLALAQETVISIVTGDDRLSKFVQLLDRAGLSVSEGLTILAPTTEAFNDWREEDTALWNKYASQSEFIVHLTHLLGWHLIIEDVLTTDQIFNGGRSLVETMYGNITLNQQYKTLENVALVDILEPNITASNGIVHVLDDVLIPPYMAVNLMGHLLDHDVTKFAFTTMANLALHVGLEDKIDAAYEHGITFMVPPNRRFVRDQVDLDLLTSDEMYNYTRDFVLSHLVMNNYHEAGVVAYNEENDQEQFMIKSELGTSFWITSTDDRVRFQSRDVIVFDQPAKNGIFHVMDLPIYPPFISDFTDLMYVSTTWDTSDCNRFWAQTLLTSEEVSKMFNSTLTMFCPTREAFAEFNNEAFQRLLEPKWYRHSAEFLFNMISTPALTRAELLERAPSTITMLNGLTYDLRKTGDLPRIKNGVSEQAKSHFGDIIALDGYLHMVDEVVTPTAVSMSIYEWIGADDDFAILSENIDFVQLNELVDTYLPLTMLAPNDDAFKRITFATLGGGDILKRHLFYDLLFCDVIANETSIESVQGTILSVELRGDPGTGLWGLDGGQNLWVGGALVYKCDILAGNGVLHYVDRVIGEKFDEDTAPPTTSPAPTTTAAPTYNIPPTAAPVLSPTAFSPVGLPPVVTVVQPSVLTDDSDNDDDKNSGVGRVSTVACFSVLALLLCVL